MKKQSYFFTFFVILSTTFVACKSSDSSAPAAPKEHFSLSNESQRELSDVGCAAGDSTISCKDIDELHGIKTMSWTKRNLENQQSILDKRVKALDIVIAELDGAKKKEWSAQTEITLTTYRATAGALKASIMASSASITAEIAKEDLFQTTLGYSCSGQYGVNNTDLKFAGSILFKENAAEEQLETKTDIPNTTGATSEVKISYWTRGTDFRLRLGSIGDPSEKINEINVMSVWMDGEFDVDWTGGAYQAKASCLRKTALNASPEEMSQRIVERARLKCENFSMKPKANSDELEYIGGSSIEANFGTEDTDEGFFTKMIDDMVDAFGEHPLKKHGVKYYFDVTTDKGEITFKLFNLEDNSVVATVKTRNSSDNISLNYLNEGYGARIDCAVPSE